MQDGIEIEPKRGIDTAIRRTDQEPILSTGELNAGVTVPKEHEILPEGEAGLSLAKESRQPSLDPKLKLPLTKPQAQLASKKGSVYDSFTWLATLVTFLFKKQEERST